VKKKFSTPFVLSLSKDSDGRMMGFDKLSPNGVRQEVCYV
jgi:hypothetical protein